MSKKQNKGPRKTAAEVVRSFTREDIEATVRELGELNTHIRKTLDAIKAMRDAGVSYEHVEVVQGAVNEGMFARRQYLESKIRRVAVAIFRSNNNFAQYVLDNLAYIPDAESKMERAAFVATVTE